MKTTTITASITYPVDEINAFADKLGYQTVVANPDYVPSVGGEEMPDPAFEGDVIDAPQIPNPDYVPAVGEPTMDNPESREEFVKRLFKGVATKWFTQFAERDITRAKQQEAQEAIEQVKSNIEAAITI